LSRLRVVLVLAVLVSLLAPSWAESDRGESSPELAPTPVSNAWHCKKLGPRALGEHTAEGRRLLRAARAASLCESVRRRYELCEPARVRWSPSAGAAPREEVRELFPRLCVILDCADPGSESATPLALDDAFGRRAVTAAGIDRLCAPLHSHVDKVGL
jgi:hypothetical protein